MDNFGIFKLLNSFFNFYEENKSDYNTQKAEKTANQTSVAVEKSNQNSQFEKNPVPRVAPLQTQMLNTVRNHDNFVKRVEEKAKKY